MIEMHERIAQVRSGQVAPDPPAIQHIYLMTAEEAFNKSIWIAK